MADKNAGRMAQTRLRKLEAEATHAQQRYDLYKGKANGSRPPEPDRLRVLERLNETAQTRLDQARSEG